MGDFGDLDRERLMMLDTIVIAGRLRSVATPAPPAGRKRFGKGASFLRAGFSTLRLFIWASSRAYWSRDTWIRGYVDTGSTPKEGSCRTHVKGR